MSVTCVPIYGLMFRILTRFHTLYFSASCIHRNSIFWRHVILARFPYWPEKRTRRISRYSYLLETLISSEYDLTISGHVTVLRQWPLEKNTDYIIINNMDHMRFKGTEISSVIRSQQKVSKVWKWWPKHAQAKRDGVINPQNYNFNKFKHENLLCSQNGTNTPESTVELSYMCRRVLTGPPEVTLTK